MPWHVREHILVPEHHDTKRTHSSEPVKEFAAGARCHTLARQLHQCAMGRIQKRRQGVDEDEHEAIFPHMPARGVRRVPSKKTQKSLP
jgi:hypothetical protein